MILRGAKLVHATERAIKVSWAGQVFWVPRNAVSAYRDGWPLHKCLEGIPPTHEESHFSAEGPVEYESKIELPRGEHFEVSDSFAESRGIVEEGFVKRVDVDVEKPDEVSQLKKQVEVLVKANSDLTAQFKGTQKIANTVTSERNRLLQELALVKQGREATIAENVRLHAEIRTLQSQIGTINRVERQTDSSRAAGPGRAVNEAKIRPDSPIGPPKDKFTATRDDIPNGRFNLLELE